MFSTLPSSMMSKCYCESDLDTDFSVLTLVSLHCPNMGTWWTVDYIYQVLSSIPIQVCMQTFSFLGNENNTSPPSFVPDGSMATLNLNPFVSHPS